MLIRHPSVRLWLFRNLQFLRISRIASSRIPPGTPGVFRAFIHITHRNMLPVTETHTCIYTFTHNIIVFPPVLVNKAPFVEKKS